ncbi:MAG: hypothetical protein ACREIC_17810, partial [Limisphaerales bacterium]
MAVGRTVPECLRGAPAATVFKSLDDFSLGRDPKPLIRSLARLYGLEKDHLGEAGRDTLDAVQRLADLRSVTYRPANSAVYGTDDFSQGLLQVARLIKARIGLDAASLDLNGWDSHFGQSTVMDPLLVRLGRGLGAFYRDMGEELAHT